MKPVNHHIRLAPRPSGLPKAPHLSSLPSRPPRPARAQIVPAVGYPSIDPATRRWISPNPADNGSVPIGTVIEAGATGQVIASEHPRFPFGQHVCGAFGVQELASSNGAGLTKLDTSLAQLTPTSGARGLTGLTAHSEPLHIGRLSESGRSAGVRRPQHARPRAALPGRSGAARAA